MGKINRLKHANVTIVSPTEEQGKELLAVIESMMMDYINRKSDEEIEQKDSNQEVKNDKKN
ncbi:hypothetical protein M3690_04360 [Priestia megaterium]|uniref:hypothetical protein n=1 Tax=Priestia megaterium TaxID=1404 RepID=UPI00203FA8AD|nr:hypothetical protein [Priestia megaterium]MCM3792525.1 hypothetical protein [Priestia megaterium]